VGREFSGNSNLQRLGKEWLNVALSLAMNTLSILLAAGTMAPGFEAYDHLLGTPFVFAVPTPMLLGRLLLLLVLPVLAGSSLRRFAPRLAETHAKSVHGASAAAVAFLLVYVMMTQRTRLAAEWQQTAVAKSPLPPFAKGGAVGGICARRWDPFLSAGPPGLSAYSQHRVRRPQRGACLGHRHHAPESH
jgi:hypothetical protein